MKPATVSVAIMDSLSQLRAILEVDCARPEPQNPWRRADPTTKNTGDDHVDEPTRFLAERVRGGDDRLCG
jgi:hypothetical protein